MPISEQTTDENQEGDTVGQQSPCAPSQKAVIWVVNPFDQLPNETDVPLRYWTLCKILAEQGHEVIWWSSDFSHLTKSKRPPCPSTDGFTVRLIETPPYKENISFTRLRNHRQFARGFYSEAMQALQSGELLAPKRIVVSLPPLGLAEEAFKIRDFINQKTESRRQKLGTHTPNSPVYSHSTTTCQVVVDIMDAWPETFYQIIPKFLRKTLGSLIMAPMHRSAKRAYLGADKISAVGQSYLDLANRYLATTRHKRTQSTHSSLPDKRMHLCYHGTDMDRFQRSMSESKSEGESADTPHSTSSVISHSRSAIRTDPLRAVYLGSMGSGYDHMTIIEVAARWKAEGQFPFQIHFAGAGSQLEKLKAEASKQGLLSEVKKASEYSPLSNLQSPIASSARVVFHGYLKKDAINELLIISDVALVTNRPDSLVACPYKAGEYAAAGLPMISCLNGELGQLLKKWDAGSEYKDGDSASLHAAFNNYAKKPERLKQQKHNARALAEALFDRKETYQELSLFISD